MNHTCLRLPSRSWSSFTDRRGTEGWVGLCTITASTCCKADRVLLTPCSRKPDMRTWYWTSRSRQSRSTFGNSRPSDKAFYNRPHTAKWSAANYITTWSMIKFANTELKQLQILFIHYTGHVSNLTVCKRTNGSPRVTSTILEWHLKLFGNICWANPSHDHAQALQAFINHIPEDLKTQNIGLPSAWRIAHRRSSWQCVEEKAILQEEWATRWWSRYSIKTFFLADHENAGWIMSQQRNVSTWISRHGFGLCVTCIWCKVPVNWSSHIETVCFHAA